jgi:hypothetical protein
MATRVAVCAPEMVGSVARGGLKIAVFGEIGISARCCARDHVMRAGAFPEPLRRGNAPRATAQQLPLLP